MCQGAKQVKEKVPELWAILFCRRRAKSWKRGGDAGHGLDEERTLRARLAKAREEITALKTYRFCVGKRRCRLGGPRTNIAHRYRARAPRQAAKSVEELWSLGEKDFGVKMKEWLTESSTSSLPTL